MRTRAARRRPGLRPAVSALVLLSLWFGRSCPGQTASVAMLLQEAPTNAGDILPGTGVHHFALNTPVTLTALPREGYQFLYWIGDVGDPASNRTMTFSDRPKIIVAVFQQSEIEVAAAARRGGGGGGSSGRSGGRPWSSGDLAPSVVDLFVPSGVSVGVPASALRRASAQGGGTEPIIIPVPTPPDDEEPVIPEPATGVLLLAGGALALRTRRGRRCV